MYFSFQITTRMWLFFHGSPRNILERCLLRHKCCKGKKKWIKRSRGGESLNMTCVALSWVLAKFFQSRRAKFPTKNLVTSATTMEAYVKWITWPELASAFRFPVVSGRDGFEDKTPNEPSVCGFSFTECNVSKDVSVPINIVQRLWVWTGVCPSHFSLHHQPSINGNPICLVEKKYENKGKK